MGIDWEEILDAEGEDMADAYENNVYDAAYAVADTAEEEDGFYEEELEAYFDHGEAETKKTPEKPCGKAKTSFYPNLPPDGLDEFLI